MPKLTYEIDHETLDLLEHYNLDVNIIIYTTLRQLRYYLEKYNETLPALQNTEPYKTYQALSKLAKKDHETAQQTYKKMTEHTQKRQQYIQAKKE